MDESVQRFTTAMNADKDAEAKRPPWRTVSVSTLPKPDKGALLRAKLLDASRRLRASKNSVAIQTDMEPTILMKEVSLGPQTDLIPYRDVGMLTDGSYAKMKEGYDKFILTYSVSQMTDYITCADMSTQTVLPKVAGDDFIRAYFNGDSEIQHSDTQFSAMERKLLDQIQRIRKSRTYIHNENPLSSSEAKDRETKLQSTSNREMPSFPLRSTFESWHFEYEGYDDPNHARSHPYVLDASRSGRTMYKPLPLSIALGSNQLARNGMDWDLLLLAIDELIQESNHLVDLIEDVTARYYAGNVRTYQNPLIKVRPIIFPSHDFPSNHWLPVVDQCEQALANIQTD